MKLRDWHYQENEKMLAALAEEGVNISEPVEVINSFVTGSQHQAEALAELLLELEFEGAYISGDPDGGDDEEWMVDTSRVFILTTQALNAMTDLCTEVAARTGVEYEGWYVETDGADDDDDEEVDSENGSQA